MIGIYLLVLTVIGAYLFFSDQIYLLAQQFNFVSTQQFESKEILRIGAVFPSTSFNPLKFDPINRSYLSDVYQGLVRANRNLTIEPAIALSWGLIDPLKWEFTLRSGVKFHNGQVLTAEDVVYSLEQARFGNESQLKNLLNTITTVEFSGTDKVIITTKQPDPLLLNKLSVVYIFPKDYQTFERPLGTGPYLYLSYENSKLSLVRFDQYWGNLPVYKNVTVQAITDREKRISALEKGEVDLLLNVPPAFGCSYVQEMRQKYECASPENENIIVKSVPSLEVGFLMFGTNDPLLKDKAIRLAIMKALDQKVLVDMAFGFARPVNQFISSGVFGFNPQIRLMPFDLPKAKEEFDIALGSSFERQKVIFYFPASLSTVGEYVKNQLNELGIDVLLEGLSDADLLAKVQKGDAGFYYLGWRSELGDAGDFLSNVLHSRNKEKNYGSYNGIYYSNEQVDKLIEESQSNLDVQKRLSQLQQIMKITIEDDIIGMPLFESDTVFAFHKSIQFTPRLDGYVYPSEIK